MPVKRIVGLVLCVLGLVWFFQGINLLKGSGMSGQAFWAVAGIAVAAIGIMLIRRSRPSAD